jgi:hypothetical protein
MGPSAGLERDISVGQLLPYYTVYVTKNERSDESNVVPVFN